VGDLNANNHLQSSLKISWKSLVKDFSCIEECMIGLEMRGYLNDREERHCNYVPSNGVYTHLGVSVCA
jgi:hypothetical protein